MSQPSSECLGPRQLVERALAVIAANPRVELCYLDDHHDQVRITAVAEVVSERSLLEEIWQANALLRRYLGNLDNPELIVYRMRPSRVRYMREWALDYMEVPFEALEQAAGLATPGRS